MYLQYFTVDLRKYSTYTVYDRSTPCIITCACIYGVGENCAFTLCVTV